MEKLVSVNVMRKSDAAEIASGTDSKTLMYRAGVGLFRSCEWHGNIDIVAGSGNNAGDGYVLALLLHEFQIPCRIICTGEKFSQDGKYYFEKCRYAGIPVTNQIDFSQTDILVDCLLGTGFHGELRSEMRAVIEQINRSSAFVLSVDINSGMYGDSGEGFCVVSDRTVSVGYLKYGHLLGMAQGKIANLQNYDIGIPCRGCYLPILEENQTESKPENWDFVPTENFSKIMDSAGIPENDAARRLQDLAKCYRNRILFSRV